jgi:hypothetical protein
MAIGSTVEKSVVSTALRKAQQTGVKAADNAAKQLSSGGKVAGDVLTRSSGKLALTIGGIKATSEGLSRQELQSATKIVQEGLTPKLEKVGKRGWVVYDQQGDSAVIHQKPSSGLFELDFKKQSDGTINYTGKQHGMNDDGQTFTNPVNGTLYDLKAKDPFVPADSAVARFDPKTPAGQKGLLEALQGATDQNSSVGVVEGPAAYFSIFTNTPKEVYLQVPTDDAMTKLAGAPTINGQAIGKDLYGQVGETLKHAGSLHPVYFGGLDDAMRKEVNTVANLLASVK